MEDGISYLSIFIFLVLSGFFSGSETAFFSLTKIKVKTFSNSEDSSFRRIYRLLSHPHRLLITVLLGNTIVNVAASSVATIIAINLSSKIFGQSSQQYVNYFVGAEIILMTILLLIFGEVAPKLIAYSKAEKFAKTSGIFVEMTYFIFYPVIKILELINKIFSKETITLKTNSNEEITSDDIHDFINSSTSNHPLMESEKKMIDGIFKFSSTKVKEIMVPRVDMVSIQINEPREKIIERIVHSGHSRIPVFKENIDNIVGFIYAKDLILNPNNKDFSKLIRTPLFVPENMKIQTMLNMFKAKKVHIAIVVDEYGGTSGLISLEDILEEVVGEIVDESDIEDEQIVKLSENVFKLSGMISIDDLNSEFDLNIDEEEYDNLAEFLYDQFNKIPEQNEKLRYNDKAIFTISKKDNQRIIFVKMRLLNS